jgi:hypothetical protein
VKFSTSCADLRAVLSEASTPASPHNRARPARCGSRRRARWLRRPDRRYRPLLSANGRSNRSHASRGRDVGRVVRAALESFSTPFYSLKGRASRAAGLALSSARLGPPDFVVRTGGRAPAGSSAGSSGRREFVRPSQRALGRRARSCAIAPAWSLRAGCAESVTACRPPPCLSPNFGAPSAQAGSSEIDRGFAPLTAPAAVGLAA